MGRESSGDNLGSSGRRRTAGGCAQFGLGSIACGCVGVSAWKEIEAEGERGLDLVPLDLFEGLSSSKQVRETRFDAR